MNKTTGLTALLTIEIAAVFVMGIWSARSWMRTACCRNASP